MKKEKQKEDSKLLLEKLKEKELLAEKMLLHLKAKEIETEQLETEKKPATDQIKKDNFDNLIGCGG